ncbi:hypothetical protein M0813_16450 [Anaeramoeba flamelloides]|uniref:Uncharacterized protein n=1 Tax=Anaeramoeba flamelloides TaxID=1746091 RepID=A0ABQ8YYQ0_9EUKA|nr:hypothetical protein M0813_16450 [Anaeramoeba flamelloides]
MSQKNETEIKMGNKHGQVKIKKYVLQDPKRRLKVIDEINEIYNMVNGRNPNYQYKEVSLESLIKKKKHLKKKYATKLKRKRKQKQKDNVRSEKSDEDSERLGSIGVAEDEEAMEGDMNLNCYDYDGEGRIDNAVKRRRENLQDNDMFNDDLTLVEEEQESKQKNCQINNATGYLDSTYNCSATNQDFKSQKNNIYDRTLSNQTISQIKKKESGEKRCNLFKFDEKIKQKNFASYFKKELVNLFDYQLFHSLSTEKKFHHLYGLSYLQTGALEYLNEQSRILLEELSSFSKIKKINAELLKQIYNFFFNTNYPINFNKYEKKIFPITIWSDEKLEEVIIEDATMIKISINNFKKQIFNCRSSIIYKFLLKNFQNKENNFDKDLEKLPFELQKSRNNQENVIIITNKKEYHKLIQKFMMHSNETLKKFRKQSRYQFITESLSEFRKKYLN